MIFSGVILHCLASGLLFRVPCKQDWSENDRDQESRGHQKYYGSCKIEITQDGHCSNQESKSKMLQNILQVKKNISEKFKGCITALRLPLVTVNAIAITSFAIGYLNFSMQVPYFMTANGFTYAESALALSCAAATNSLARVLMAVLSDRKWFSVQVVYMTGACVAGSCSCCK